MIAAKILLKDLLRFFIDIQESRSYRQEALKKQVLDRTNCDHPPSSS